MKNANKIKCISTMMISIPMTALGQIRAGFATNSLPANDDRFTMLIPLGFDVSFFGNLRSGLFVNNNGNVTFTSGFGGYTPSGIDLPNTEIIAPFFADVDTSNSGSGIVTYGVGIVDGRNAFGVNWLNVGYYPSRADKLNSFQLVIVDRGDVEAGDFDFEFNYRQIQWETGNGNGFGGDSARVGFSNGGGSDFKELAGSGVNGSLLDGGALELISRTNIGEPGRLVFAVRNGDVLAFDDDLTSSLLSGFTTQAVARNLPGLTLNGAHHRLLMDTPVGSDGWHSWATGDFSRHDKLNANQVTGEVGASRNIGSQNLRFGLGLGRSAVDQDMVLGGGSNIQGNYLLAELDYKIPNTSVVVSGLAYYGQWDADITRGYLNAGLPDQSRGSTDLRSMAFRLRADWQDAYTHGKWAVTPRLAFTVIDTHGDGYTETGGGFPVRFNAQNNTEQEIRFGVDIDYAINERTEIRTILETVHRLDDSSALTGNILGVGGFNFPTDKLNTTWGRVGVELSHELRADQYIRASLFTSTAGSDATISGSIGYSISF